MNRSSAAPAAALALVVLLAACTAGQSPSSSPVPATPTPAPTGAPTPAATPTEEPVPTDAPGEFTCDFPIVQAASTTQRANILDVRVGTHAGYDRVVFEFTNGTPEFTLAQASPPFVQDGSGLPVEVDGAAFLQLVMRNGTKQTDTGASSYGGPTAFAPGFPQLVNLVETGDFEAQSTWVLGLADDACARILLLDAPHRLVIDIEQ